MNMRKRRLAAVLLSGIMLFSTQPSQASEKESELISEPLKCILFYADNKGITSVIAQAGETMEKKLTDDNQIRLSVYPLDNNAYSSTAYKAQIAIDLHADVLILSGSASGDNMEAFSRLQEAGVRLILIDGDLPESGRWAYIGTDNEAAGRQCARLLADELDQVKAGIISSPISNSGELTGSRQERASGFKDEISVLNEQHGQGSFEISANLICAADPDEGEEDIQDLIKKNPDLNALFCLDSASGVMAAHALEALNRTDVYIACMDMPDQVASEMETGGIDAALVQDAQQCGVLCAEILEEMYDDPEAVKGIVKTVPCKIIHSGDIQVSGGTVIDTGEKD